MGRRINYPCKICGQMINLKTIPDDDLMWESDDDGIAHASCLGDDYNVDHWITHDEMRDACL